MTQWGLDTLFNPAKRHMDEEKRRLQATRQQVGDTSGGKRIDFESGKVRIKPGGKHDSSDDATDDPADAEASDATVEAAEDLAVDATVDAPADKVDDKVDAKAAPKVGGKAAHKAPAKKELTPAQ